MYCGLLPGIFCLRAVAFELSHLGRIFFLNLFEDPQREIKQERVAAIKRQRDQKLQTTILKLQQKLGNKNVVLHLAVLKKGSTTKERNAQIGGHQA